MGVQREKKGGGEDEDEEEEVRMVITVEKSCYIGSILRIWSKDT